MAMHLLSTIDARYMAPFEVTVRSVLDHLPVHREVDWHVLCPVLPEEQRLAVFRLADSRPVRFHWHPVPEDALSAYPVRGHFVPMVYARVLAPDILPSSVDRLLYLDADLLVPLAHWITPEVESRRFDTRFLAAALPPRQAVQAHATETDTAWSRT